MQMALMARPLESIDFALLERCYAKARWRWYGKPGKRRELPNEARIRESTARLAGMCRPDESISSGGMKLFFRDGTLMLRLDRKLERVYSEGK